MPNTTRTERDPLGEKQVPADALYGIQTQRALQNRYSRPSCVARCLVVGATFMLQTGSTAESAVVSSVAAAAGA